MPKNTKKEKIKQAILKDEASLVSIANEFGVKQPYISQLKIEVDRDKYHNHLKFLYDIMNTKMTFKDRPNQSEITRIKEVKALI